MNNSATIDKQELVEMIQDSIGLRPEEKSTYVEWLLKLCCIDVSKNFSTLFHKEETKDSDDTGVINLPADTMRIISVQQAQREAMPLDLREKNIYSTSDFTYANQLFASVKQEKDKVVLQLVPKSKHTSVLIVYQTMNGGIGNIPYQYQEVLFLGTRYRYLSTRKELEPALYNQAKKDYRDMKNALKLEQNKMYPNARFKQFWEPAVERNQVNRSFDETRDV